MRLLSQLTPAIRGLPLESQVQLSLPLTVNLPFKLIGDWVATVALVLMGGLSATSICTMRLEPGFCPTCGVTARAVSSHTGLMSVPTEPTGRTHVVPGGITCSRTPSQQTWLPAAWAAPLG